MARAQRSHHYFELVLGRNEQGRSRAGSSASAVEHRWTTLATGPFDYQIERPLHAALLGSRAPSCRARSRSTAGGSFIDLGIGPTRQPQAWRHGKFGLVSYGGERPLRRRRVVAAR